MTEPPAPDVAVVVLSTAPDPGEADRIARVLVEEQLAACVTRIPGARSIFPWEGDLQEEDEVLLLIKTHARRAPELTRRLAEVHPYDVPEILVLPVAAGLGAYLDWVRTSTAADGNAS